jgi:P pilus assembly chaperone PapD
MNSNTIKRTIVGCFKIIRVNNPTPLNLSISSQEINLLNTEYLKSKKQKDSKLASILKLKELNKKHIGFSNLNFF